MSRLFFIVAILCSVLVSCEEEENLPGSISGFVTDLATGKPIETAGVEMLPKGQKTVTGTDGHFEFNDVEHGEYRLSVTKVGYQSLVTDTISVKSGESVSYNIQLKKNPPSLKVVDANTNKDITSINLELDKKSATFNIFNDGPESLEWQITVDDDWISSVSKESGSLKSGATQAIILKIDRTLLKTGKNTTTIHVTSDNGSKNIVLVVTSDYELPILNTLEAEEVTRTSALVKGKLLKTGTPKYNERGFVYGLSSMPTIENTIAKITVAVSETSEYSAKLIGLSTDETYYVRAYAINDFGVAYSTNEIKVIPEALPPIVTTEDCTDLVVSTSSVTLNGFIDREGDPKYTEKGFVYGFVHNPTVEDDLKKVVVGTGKGKFSANLNLLEINKIYYVRAYATNETGTSYGNEVKVDMSVVPPVVTTLQCTEKSYVNDIVTFNGKITSAGDPEFEEKGFVYGLTHNPTIEDNKISVSGINKETFSVKLTTLELDKLYYVRAYALNKHVIVYGGEVVCDMSVVKPKIKTKSVSSIGTNEPVYRLYGEILNEGDPAYIESGFVYGQMQTPTFDNGASVIKCAAQQRTQADVMDLVPGTLYYVRFYVKTEYDIYYADDILQIEVQHPMYYTLSSAKLMIMRNPVGSSFWEDAKKACEACRIGGYTDWRLPTRQELLIVSTLFSKIGLPYGNDTRYWSSENVSGKSDHYYIRYYYGWYTGCDNSWCDAFAVRTIK